MRVNPGGSIRPDRKSVNGNNVGASGRTVQAIGGDFGAGAMNACGMPGSSTSDMAVTWSDRGAIMAALTRSCRVRWQAHGGLPSDVGRTSSDGREFDRRPTRSGAVDQHGPSLHGVRAPSNRKLAVATPFPRRGRPCTLEPQPRGRNTLPVARASVHARNATSRSQHPSRGAGVRARSKRNLAVATPFPRRGRPCTLEPQTRGRTSQVRTPFMRGPGMATSTRSSTRCRRSPHRPHSSPSLPPQPSRCRPAGSVHAGSSPRDESRRTTAGSRG